MAGNPLPEHPFHYGGAFPSARPFGAARLHLDTPAGGRKRGRLHPDPLPEKTPAGGRDHLSRRGREGPLPRRFLAAAFDVRLLVQSGNRAVCGRPFIDRLGKLLGEEISERLYSTVNIGLELAAWGIPPAAALLATVLAAGWGNRADCSALPLWGFCRLPLGGGHLHRTGLISNRRMLVRTDRLSAVSVRQSLLMRFLRLYGAYLHTVGTGKDKGTAAC